MTRSVLYCYYIVARDVFKLLATKYKKLDLIVGASFFEIYSGKVSVVALLYCVVDNISVLSDTVDWALQ